MEVNCSYKKLILIEELKPNPDNPNRHSNEQIEKLAAVINYQGWRAPIVVSNLSGYIVKGHGRLMAAEKAGYKKVPVDFQDYDSLEQEKADLIADNRLAELSEWNDLKLNDMLAELKKSENLDIELSGYSADGLKPSIIKYAIKKPEIIPLKNVLRTSLNSKLFIFDFYLTDHLF